MYTYCKSVTYTNSTCTIKERVSNSLLAKVVSVSVLKANRVQGGAATNCQ